MFMNGSQDSDSRSPLMVYIRSRSAARRRNFERAKEHLKKTQQEYKEYNKQNWTNPKQWKDYGDLTWSDETMAVNPTAAAGGTANYLMKQPPLARI